MSPAPAQVDLATVRARADQGDPEALNALGNAFANAGKQQAAVEQYREALRLNPKYAKAYCNLGAALSTLGRLPEAIEQYRQALRPD